MRGLTGDVGKIFRRGGREVVITSVGQEYGDCILVEVNVHDAGPTEADGSKPIRSRRIGIPFNLAEVPALISHLQRALEIGQALAVRVGSAKRDDRTSRRHAR